MLIGAHLPTIITTPLRRCIKDTFGGHDWFSDQPDATVLAGPAQLHLSDHDGYSYARNTRQVTACRHRYHIFEIDYSVAYGTVGSRSSYRKRGKRRDGEEEEDVMKYTRGPYKKRVRVHSSIVTLSSYHYVYMCRHLVKFNIDTTN